MANSTYERDGGGYIKEIVETESQTATIEGHLKYRVLSVSVSKDKIINDGVDTVTVTITVLDGLDIARGTDPGAATVLDYDGNVSILIEGNEMTKLATNGTVQFELTADKTAGSSLECVAVGLDGHPAEGDREVIEVVSE